MRNECGQVGLFLNSIEMMESGRCGRRKQRNPKRKNVENGEDTEEIEEGTLDDNKNKIITDEQSQGEETDTENNSNHGNQQLDGRVSPETKPQCLKPQSTEEKVSAILKEIQSAAPDSTSDGDKGRGPQKRKQVEDAKIAELLNRQDTAVIYPEPCEDGDEQHNEGPVSEDEEVVLKCMHCSQTFLRAIVLRDHMREMHADKPLKFMCPKCDETFHQKSQLDKHLTLHSPTSQNCSVCNKLFANVYRLQRHMISHNESTDLRKFKCQECGKAFKFKHHLKEHVRIHSGEKPFICNNCGKRFSHSGSFSSHTTSKKCWGLSAHKNRLGVEGSQNLSQSPSQPTSQSIGMFGQKIPLAFTGNKIQTQFERSPLQSVPITLAHQQHFLPAIYSQQKGTGTFFYPPAMFATPEGFLQPMFSVSQSIPTSLQQQSLNLTTSTKQVQQDQDTNKDTTSDSSSQAVSTTSIYGRSPRSLSPHSQSTRSFSPQSHSGRSVSPMSTSIMSSPPSHPRRSMTPFSERAISHSPHSHSEQISPDVNSNTKLLIIEKDKTDTSSEDQKETEDNNHDIDIDIKAEKPDTDNAEVKSESSDSNSDSQAKKSPPTCQYCGEEFESPVVHHQHERYMCKLNKDIVQQRSQSEPCQSPHSTVSDISHSESSTLNGSIGHDTDEEDVDELYKDSDISFDERKMRIRSLFTEEQQSYLKAQYLINPRPKKHVLIQIGNKLGFPKRVIQVWFQNMRARERKQGREHVIGVPNVKTENGKDIEVPKSSTYIPNVPKPFPNLLSMSQQSQVQVCGQRIQSVGEVPLDLTVRKSPPLAHGGLSRLSTPDRSSDDQALNLSVKKDSSEERENSKDVQTKISDASQAQQQKSLQDSAIFKYMQQEGLIQNKNITQITSSVSPSLAHTLQNHILHQSMASVLKMPAFSTSSEQKSTSSMLFEDPSSTSSSRFDHESKLVIDEGLSDPTQAPNLKETQSQHTPVLLHVPLPDPGLHEATHNLTTLAEAAQHAAAQHAANILSGKPKRLRKKTWRQMEAEEVQLELEDSLSNDEDHPSKKKRKSWKSHRVDRDEGMYGCDQCNKVFSKQSSLARHKYEHSGARPFACDLCTKSFKHKHHLTEHKRLHSGEKPFQCKKCGKRFSHSGSFSQHMNHRYNYCSPNKTSDGDCELSSQDSP